MITMRYWWILGQFVLALLAIGPFWPVAASGAKPASKVDRPIVYWNGTEIVFSDLAGSREVVFKEGDDLYYGGGARWSPDGGLIGGYFKRYGYDEVLGSNLGFMVGTPDGAVETALLTTFEFDVWNRSRPGVDQSMRDPLDVPSWLGTDAVIFSAITWYDVSLFDSNVPPHSRQLLAKRLFVVDFDGNIRPLTEAATFGATLSDTEPHWSPALDKVVFVGSSASGNDRPWGELYAINPDGTGLVQITDFGRTLDLSAPVWSPTGDRILVSTSTESPLLMLGVDLNQPNPGTGPGGRVTFAQQFKPKGGSPAWSPDGRQILFDRRGNTGSQGVKRNELVIADAETGEERVIRTSQAPIRHIDWRPLP